VVAVAVVVGNFVEVMSVDSEVLVDEVEEVVVVGSTTMVVAMTLDEVLSRSQELSVHCLMSQSLTLWL
jgi:hypothetical protein